MTPGSLGATGLPVSRLGLGLAALGRPAYITAGRDADLGSDRSVPAMEARCHAMLDAAYAAGIRYVDAARSYGHAERFLASWLARREVPSRALTIGSKWGYAYIGEWRLDAPVHESKDLSAANLERQFAETSAILGDALQVFQIHSATIESGVLDDRAVLTALSRLRAGGLAIGLTVTGPSQRDVIRRALDVRVDGNGLFQVVQATWNLMETAAAPALIEAHAAGWGVIVKEAFANGRLTDGYDGSDARPARDQARRLGVPLDALALAAALSQTWADVVLTGAVTREQLRSNLSAFELTAAARDLPPLARPPQEYWDRRSALPWR